MDPLLIPFFFGLAYLLPAIGWLTALAVASWLFRPTTNRQAPLKRLGIVIPAHNEEAGIGATIASIRQCDYPAELLEIFVIADNCSDETAAAADQAGARVFVRIDEARRGKGQALDWFIREQQAAYGNLEGICIIDADVLCDQQLFKELSASLSAPGVRVVQAFNGVANIDVNWRTALMTMAFNLFNHLRMAGSFRLCGTSSLKGLGMAFDTSLLADYGWPAYSKVEDVEFTLRLVEDRVPIHYNPKAIITSEMAILGSQAATQRKRWEGGRFRLATATLPALLARICRGEFRFLPLAMELALLPLSLLVAMTLAGVIWAWLFFPETLPLLFGLVGCLIFAVVSAQLQRRLPLRLWLHLAAAPFFILWKLALYIEMLATARQDAGWERTVRASELDQKKPQ